MGSEQIAPCPDCGGEGVIEVPQLTYDEYVRARCRNCGAMMSVGAWNFLSRAAALLRAVEGIEAYHREHWQHSIAIEVMSDETISIYSARGIGHGESLAAALVALAKEATGAA